MASEKRDFSNFNEFPGKIVDNRYEFPHLYKVDRNNNKRIWKIIIRLVKDNKRQDKINWNLLTEDEANFDNKYLNQNYLPDGVITQLWTESGVVEGKITRKIPTYYDKVVLKNRANQRSSLQQAMIHARAEYLKKFKEGAKPLNYKCENTKMYFPMLAKPWKTGNKHLKYPLHIQPKLDGVRCLVYISKKNGNPTDVVLYTRTQKIFPDKNYLKEILCKYLNSLYTNESIILDGELYKHGESLQDISGKSRNVDSETLKELNQYHIYDCFYPSKLEMTFVERNLLIKKLFKEINSDKVLQYESIKIPIHPNEILKEVCTTKVNNLEEGKKLFKEYISKKYEGVMFRNSQSTYMADNCKSNMRSNDLVKMKNKFSEEFEVVDFKEGSKGKDKGAIIWVCKNKKGTTFNVTPKDMTYEQRYDLYKDAIDNFEKKYKNRMLTVEYEDLSKKNIPLRAKGVSFRNYE